MKTPRRIITASNNITLLPALRGARMERNEPIAVYPTPAGLRFEPFDPAKQYPETMRKTRVTVFDRIYVSPKLAQACGLGRQVEVITLPQDGFILAPITCEDE